MRTSSLHWSFYTDQETTPSFICGTIHIGLERCSTYWPLISEFIQKYNRIYTESSLDPRVQVLLQPSTLLPEGVSVHDYISHRRWSKMRSQFIRFTKVDIDQLKMLHPLFILTTIQLELLGVRGQASLDQRIWNQATEEGKFKDGIESPQEQVFALKSMDLSALYLQLVRVSKRISGTRAQLNRLIDIYVSQDIHKMYKVTKRTMGNNKGSLIYKRNQVIGQRLLRLHKEEPSFFSFGAGHLAGHKGVLRYLKSEGAHIVPISK